KGDILLGDRAFGEFTTLAALPLWLGVDVVARLHACRKVDFRKSQRLSKHEGLFVWNKGYQQSEVLSAKEWGLLPAGDHRAHYSLHRHHPRVPQPPHHAGHLPVRPQALSSPRV